MSKLPDSSNQQASCSGPYTLALRFGWMWPNNAPALGGTCRIVGAGVDGSPHNIAANGIVEIPHVPLGIDIQVIVAIQNMPEITWQAHTSFCANETPGSVSEKMKRVQAMLNNLGVMAGPANGTATARTKWAIAWYQRKKMSLLEGATGLLTEASLKHLKEAYSNYNLPLEFEKGLSTFNNSSPNWDLRAFNKDAILRREWAQTDAMNHTDNASFDHDPLSANAFTPVWGATVCESVSLFTTEEPARLFVLPKTQADALKKAGKSTYLNTLYLPQAVAWLQDHLDELGFGAVTGSGTFESVVQIPADAGSRFVALQDTRSCFGRYTEWSVRDFQYYAQFKHVAKEKWPDDNKNNYSAFYADRLKPIMNEKQGLCAPPSFPTPAEATGASGAVNLTTATAIRYWLDKRFRCPVVIFGTKALGTTATAATEPLAADATVTQRLAREGVARKPHDETAYYNIWRYTQCQNSSPRIVAMDFTSLPDLESTWTVADSRRGLPFVLGEYTNFGDQSDGGPMCHFTRQSWPEAAIPTKPDTLLQPYSNASTVDPAVPEVATSSEELEALNEEGLRLDKDIEDKRIEIENQRNTNGDDHIQEKIHNIEDKIEGNYESEEAAKKASQDIDKKYDAKEKKLQKELEEAEKEYKEKRIKNIVDALEEEAKIAKEAENPSFDFEELKNKALEKLSELSSTLDSVLPEGILKELNSKLDDILEPYKDKLSTIPNSIPVPIVLSQQDIDSAASTLRVIRAVGQVECYNFFDCFQAYDRGIFSSPVYHWIMGLAETAQNGACFFGAGELPALISYLAYRLGTNTKGSYRWALHNVGLASSFTATEATPWPKADGDLGHRARIQFQRHDGTYAPTKTMPKGHANFIKLETHYFRNWHFCYRWAMMGRTDRNFHKASWDMARLRIKDILAAPLRKDGPTIGSVFNSERLVAMLLRWHVNSPAGIIKNKSGNEKAPDKAEAEAMEESLWVTNPEGALAACLVANSTKDGLGNKYLSSSLPTNNKELQHSRNFVLYEVDLP